MPEQVQHADNFENINLSLGYAVVDVNILGALECSTKYYLFHLY